MKRWLRNQPLLPLSPRTYRRRQMFRHGSVHCDPHGANVLVRPHPRAKKGSGRPQLVLLDHGLYRELTEQFRVDHCRLWKAMVFKDVRGMITTGLLAGLPICMHVAGSRGCFSRCFADGATGAPVWPDIWVVYYYCKRRDAQQPRRGRSRDTTRVCRW